MSCSVGFQRHKQYLSMIRLERLVLSIEGACKVIDFGECNGITYLESAGS